MDVPFTEKSQNKKPRPHTHYLILSIVSAILFVVILLGVLGARTPQPTLVTNEAGYVPVNQALEIEFSWPIARDAEVQVTPSVFGTVSYADAMVQDQLVKKIVFTPELTWLPDTTYEIAITNVHSAIPSLADAEQFTLTFTTDSLPQIMGVSLDEGEEIRPDATWEIMLDKPAAGLAEMSFTFEPEVPFTSTLSEDGLTYSLKPDAVLSQGQTYSVSTSRAGIRYLFGTEEVAFRQEPTELSDGTWTVREAPGIESFSPQGNNVALASTIDIAFSENVDFESFKDFVTIEPALTGQWTTLDYKTITFTPSTLAQDTTYTVTLAEGLPTFEGGYLPEAATHQFTSLGPVVISATSPASGGSGASVDSNIRITFDQAVDQASAESKFSISPAVEGGFSWDGNTLVFTPSAALEFNTTYTATVASGVKSVGGIDSASDQTTSFATELSVTKLGVSYDRQDHNLSCEVATLKMALNYYGVNVDEQPLIDAIGFDPTAKSGGVWGNPHVAFVGDIDGRQPSTGYGVYWEPIASAGAPYRTTRAFTGAELGHIIGEIQLGHPVIIWGTAGTGSRIDWQTPEGDNIVAVNGEHTFVVIGYVGSAGNPTKIIVIDPLVGERYLTTSHFLWMWGLLGNSGVVVE